MSVVAKSQVLKLYRDLLRAGLHFPDYNVSSFILRRAKSDFRANVGLSGQALQGAYKHGVEQLDLINRQSIIRGMYKKDPLVMENLYKDNKRRIASIPNY